MAVSALLGFALWRGVSLECGAIKVHASSVGDSNLRCEFWSSVKGAGLVG
jgi:hypothetical protein